MHRDEFQLTLKAMKTLGFGPENTAELLRITAGLLHLGQVNFVGTSDGEGSAIDSSPYVQQAIKTAAGKIFHFTRLSRRGM
jgi:myosin heavy subunit